MPLINKTGITTSAIGLLLAIASASAGANEKNQSLQAACAKKLTTIEKSQAKRQKICACIAENLAAKLTATELSLITKNYAGDPSAARQLRQEKYSPAVDYDLDAASKCMEDPSWRVNADKSKKPSDP